MSILNVMTRIALFLFVIIASVAYATAADPVIYLVRHAEKADEPGNKDPNLSEAGRVRAQELADIVKAVGITAIYATEYKRTQQTAAPLVALTNIPLTIVPAKDTAALITKLRKDTGCVLVIGHSNTLPKIIKDLGVGQPVTISESDYDNIYVVKLETNPPGFQQLHF